jgi:hypothetical protein
LDYKAHPIPSKVGYIAAVFLEKNMPNLKDTLLIAGGIAIGWMLAHRAPANELNAATLTDILNDRHNEPFQNYRQLEALVGLYQQLDPVAPLPPMRRWAISPDFAIAIMQQVRKTRPQLVVEASCGASTIVTAYTLKQNGSGKVVSLEQDEAFAEITRQRLVEHKLDDIATIIHAPITLLQLNNQEWPWYSTDGLSDLKNIDMLTVDGPSQWGLDQAMVRYPALPYFYEKLSLGATILVDDTNRDHEKRAVARWIKEYALVQVAELETEKGTIILQKP